MTKKKKQEEKKYTTASVWKQRFENRENKLKPLFDDAKKYYDIMYAVQNTTKISPWKSKVYVPILASKAWDLIARMSDVVPLFNVKVKGEYELDDETGSIVNPQVVVDRQRRIEAKLQGDYNSGDQPMKLRVFDPLVDAVVAGTGYAYVPWVFEERRHFARPFDSAGNMDNTQTVVKKIKQGHNGFEGINFFNVFPGDGPSFFEMPYLIIRFYKPLVDLETSGLYENLDKVDTGERNDMDFSNYNVSRNRVVNEQEITESESTVKMVTGYECYERTADGLVLTTYAEGDSDDPDTKPWVEIRKPSTPFWHNMYPVVPFYMRKKSYSTFGESLFENNRTLQSATNDLFNHYLDNWNLSIESMIMYEDGSLTNDFIVEPGGEITFTGEAPKQFKFPEPNPQQLSVVMNVLEKGVESATFSNYASGVANSSTDKTQGTAYGVKSITEAATTKIGFFRDNFKQSMKIVGRIWLSNLQQFADDPEEVTRREGGQELPDVVVPSDYQGELELEIDDDSMTPLTKQDKRDAQTQMLGEMQMIQKMAFDQFSVFKDASDIPRYNLVEFAQDLTDLYSKKDISRYLLPSEAPQEEPVSNTKELLNFNYKDAPPFVKKQIEAAFDLQPDPAHDLAANNYAAQLGKENAEIMSLTPTGEINGNPGKENSPTGAQA